MINPVEKEKLEEKVSPKKGSSLGAYRYVLGEETIVTGENNKSYACSYVPKHPL